MPNEAILLTDMWPKKQTRVDVLKIYTRVRNHFEIGGGARVMLDMYSYTVAFQTANQIIGLPSFVDGKNPNLFLYGGFRAFSFLWHGQLFPTLLFTMTLP